MYCSAVLTCFLIVEKEGRITLIVKIVFTRHGRQAEKEINIRVVSIFLRRSPKKICLSNEAPHRRNMFLERDRKKESVEYRVNTEATAPGRKNNTVEHGR